MENKIFHRSLNFNEVFISWVKLTELSSKDLNYFKHFWNLVFHSLWTQKGKNRRVEFSLDSEKLEWSLTIQGMPSMQKGAPGNMQLLLLSVKPCQKSIALKTTARFLWNICDMSGSSNPRGELWQLKGSSGSAGLQGSRVDAIPGCSRNSPAAAVQPHLSPLLLWHTCLWYCSKTKKCILCKLCWIAQLLYSLFPLRDLGTFPSVKRARNERWKLSPPSHSLSTEMLLKLTFS